MPTAFLVPWPGGGTYFELLVLERENIPSGEKKKNHTHTHTTVSPTFSLIFSLLFLGSRLWNINWVPARFLPLPTVTFQKVLFWGKKF